MERSETIETWREIELRLESNLPVLYEGSFRSLIMHHPRYELKDKYLGDFSCEFCFLSDGGKASPCCTQDLVRKKIPLFVGMVEKKAFLFEHGKSLYENDGCEFERCPLFRKMTVSKDGKNISHAITIENKAYRGFVLLRVPNWKGTYKGCYANCVSINTMEGDFYTPIGCASFFPGSYEPLIIFFHIPKPSPDEDENSILPKNKLCLAWGGDCNKLKEVDIDTSEAFYPRIFFSESK